MTKIESKLQKYIYNWLCNIPRLPSTEVSVNYIEAKCIQYFLNNNLPRYRVTVQLLQNNGLSIVLRNED